MYQLISPYLTIVGLLTGIFVAALRIWHGRTHLCVSWKRYRGLMLWRCARHPDLLFSVDHFAPGTGQPTCATCGTFLHLITCVTCRDA